MKVAIFLIALLFWGVNLFAADVRDGDLRTLNDYFPFTQVDNSESWAKRAERLRMRTKVALGVWPEPEKTPLDAVIHGLIDRPEYTVERVYFQSLPGHYVTGSLYRPKNAKGKIPAVLSPHGHWPAGRFHAHSDAQIKKEVEIGAEQFERGGRHPLQARCVQLARMGCMVFHYDMIGYADSIQFREHRPGVREHMNTSENWGMFSPQAELRMLGLMQLQTWNSIRSVDFVLSLPEVDPERIGVTGASGGATQTMMLMAVDERPDIAFPAVMVSTSMQGGCPCENASYLRINSGNIDIAALCAPRPLALSGADDWTVDIMTSGWPDLQKVYRLAGVPNHVHAEAFTQFKHNFNAVSRKVMYSWFNDHWKLTEGSLAEQDYEPLTREELTVWTEGHEKPEGGDAHERAVMQWFAGQDVHVETRNEFEAIHRPAWEVILGRTLIDYAEVKREGDLLQNSFGEKVAVLDRDSDLTDGTWVIALGDFPREALAGTRVLSSHLYRPGGKNRLGHYGRADKPWQRFAGYTYGYNHSLFVQRVHDVLTMVKYAQGYNPGKIILVAREPFTPVALAARSILGDHVNTLVVEQTSFEFVKVNAFEDPMFVPGAVKYGGVEALYALNGGMETVILDPSDKGVTRVENTVGKFSYQGVVAPLVVNESLETYFE